MNAFRVAARAARDIDDVLRHSQAEFGPEAADRYRRLFDAAIELVRIDADRPGVRRIANARTDLRLFHLRLARGRLAVRDRIGHPRHVLVFRYTPGRIELLRILHDAMDLPAHLQEL